jgi:hypothetical protein
MIEICGATAFTTSLKTNMALAIARRTASRIRAAG